VINFLLGWLVFDEDLSVSRFIGFALVWVALVILSADTIRRARSAAVPTV
jgi:chloramphenicol-sensitive protein RarD